MAESLRDGRLMRSASKYVLPWLVRAQRERIAIVITDNLKTHTSAGSLLVRSMLTELQELLYLVYTPAYDPDANRTPMAQAPFRDGS
jgi:transposase